MNLYFGLANLRLLQGRVLRRELRRGSKKGLSRRRLEGRNTPFREYDPLLRVPKCCKIPSTVCFETTVDHKTMDNTIYI